MTTARFDTAISILIETAVAAGLDLASDEVLVVRDAAGRLAVLVAPKHPIKKGFAAELRAALGAYTLGEGVLPSSIFHIARGERAREIFVTGPDQDLVGLRVIDRRVVGMDWLDEFSAQAEGPPRLVFGSLKGGVGRSTALAVLAADLAEHGRKVLCVDLDLEAPGVGSMLLQDNDSDDRRPKFGTLDYLVENGLAGVQDEDLFDHIGVSHFANGGIHVLPAVGRVTDENPENMVGKLSRALTEDIGEAGRVSVSAQIREMLDRFVARENYDAVLIDARAGLAETTAASWLGTGARKLLLFGTDQPQTFRGYRYAFSHLIQFGTETAERDDADDWRGRISFVQSKAPNIGSRRESFREKLHLLCIDTLYDADEGAESELNFNFAFSAQGADIPHDATYIENNPAYEVFDPLANGELLASGAYQGPFGAFLKRAWEILELERTE